MSCPDCDDARYPDPSEGRFLPIVRCPACGYQMNADERSVWNAAFGAAHVASGEIFARTSEALVRAGAAVLAHRSARQKEAEGEPTLPAMLEPVFNAFTSLRRSFVASRQEISTYIARHKVLEALEAVVDPAPHVRASYRILEQTSHTEVTLEIVEAIEYVALGRAGAMRRAHVEESLASRGRSGA